MATRGQGHDVTSPHGGVPAWRFDLDLTDPRQAYAAGMVDGYLQRCAEQDAEDDAVHRAAAQRATRLADRPARNRAPSTEGQQVA